MKKAETERLAEFLAIFADDEMLAAFADVSLPRAAGDGGKEESGLEVLKHKSCRP